MTSEVESATTEKDSKQGRLTKLEQEIRSAREAADSGALGEINEDNFGLLGLAHPDLLFEIFVYGSTNRYRWLHHQRRQFPGAETYYTEKMEKIVEDVQDRMTTLGIPGTYNPLPTRYNPSPDEERAIKAAIDEGDYKKLTPYHYISLAGLSRLALCLMVSEAMINHKRRLKEYGREAAGYRGQRVPGSRLDETDAAELKRRFDADWEENARLMLAD